MQHYSDDDHELAVRNAEITRRLLAQANEITPDIDAQTLGLVTAATVLIEQAVGARHASPILIGLLQPTLAEWQQASRQRLQ